MLRSLLYAVGPDISVYICADNHWWSACRACNIYFAQTDPLTCSSRATFQISHNTALQARASPPNIFECDIRYIDMAGILGTSSFVDVEVTLVEYDWVIGVGDIHVFVCDIGDIPKADIWTRPCLETSPVLAIQ